MAETKTYDYENEVKGPQNQGMPVKYKTKQYATKTNPSLLGLLGKNKTAFGELSAGAGLAGDVLSYMRPEQDPNEFRTEAHERAKIQANQALSTGRENSNRIMGTASNISNMVGNKATQALLAQSANSGHEGGNAAAAVGSIGKDRSLSEATLNAVGMGANMSNQVEQQGFQNQLGLSQDTILTDPGAPMDESILAGVGALPSTLTDAKRGMVENEQLNRYDRDTQQGDEILSPEEQRLKDEAAKAVPAQPNQIPMMNAQANPSSPLEQPGSATLGMVGATDTMSMLGMKKPPLDLTRPKPKTQPSATMGMLGQNPLNNIMKPKGNFTQWGK
jgi:hypothetical protein